MKRKQKYGDIPIYITENSHGSYDAADENSFVEDDERIQFLSDFLNKS